MQELKQRFPAGVDYAIPYETAGFVRSSIREVVKTLFEAVVLVFLVIFVFLKRFRATLIPCLAVPVSIIGAFAGMYAFGFSINTLTLFALILAIGTVIDDAIIVIENVERIMRVEGLAPREATIKAMQQVTGPPIAIVLVLCAVFAPVSFIPGLAGTLYRQFAITISISVFISGIVALTLTPALARFFYGPGAAARMGFWSVLTPGLKRAPAVCPHGRPHHWARSGSTGGVLPDDRRDAVSVRAGAGSLVPDEETSVICSGLQPLTRARRCSARNRPWTRSKKLHSPIP